MSADRLLRAKFLFNEARNQLESFAPFSAGMTVSLLQDAVEAMAHEVASIVGARMKTNPSFLEHWEAIANVPPNRLLPYRVDMDDLNSARVGFKHRGNNPDRADAERHTGRAHLFLLETAKTFFDVNFDELSEVDLVADNAVRAALKAGELAAIAGNVEVALERCRDAMDLVDKTLRESIVVAPNRVHIVGGFGGMSQARAIESILSMVTGLEKSLMLSVLRINPVEYWFLKSVLPLKSMGNTYQIVERAGAAPARTVELAHECVRIALRIALRADLVKAEARRLGERAGFNRR